MPGNSSQAQVIGANIDFVAVVTDAGPDFNIRRMERYFTLISRSGVAKSPGGRLNSAWVRFKR